MWKIVDELTRDLSARTRRQIRWSLRQNRMADVPSRAYWIRRAYSASARRRQRLLASRTVNLTDLIESLAETGYTEILVSPPGETKTRFTYKGGDIGGVLWIPRTAVGAYKEATYIQLDCSFRTRPFVYCVAQAIIANEAVPLGFIIGPSESEWIYATFMERLWSFIPGYRKLPVLSDQGPGVTAFCAHRNIQQFFCHRHLIQKWGAATAVAMLVARVLKIYDKDEYVRLRPQFLAEAISLRKKGHMSKNALKAFSKWLTPGDLADGIWHRLAAGVARCSNHAERFHGVVNQAVRRAGVTSLPGRLRILQEEILRKIGAYSSTNRRSLKDALNALKRKNQDKRDTCNDPACVGYCAMMASRLGLKSFPCAHTVHNHRCAVPELPPIDRPEDVAFFDGMAPKEPILRFIRASVPSFQSAAFRPKAKLDKTTKKKFVVVWDDEDGPEDPVDPADDVHELVYQIGRGILTGVFYLRYRSKRSHAFDKIKVTFGLLKHFFKAYKSWKAGAGDVDELSLHTWCAEYAAGWYHWAIADKDCPAGPKFLASLKQDAEPVDDEPVDTSAPHVAEVDAHG
jgi:hypothetical protein